MNHGQHADITPLAKGKNVIEDLGLTEGRIVQSGAEERTSPEVSADREVKL